MTPRTLCAVVAALFSFAWSAAGAEVPAAGAEVPAADSSAIAVLGDQPLTLADCVRIGRTSNLSLKVERGEVDKARAVHHGTTGRFMPVFALDAVRENTREERVPGPGAEFENDLFLMSVDQFLPTGARVNLARSTSDANTPGLITTPARTTSQGWSAVVTQPLLRGGGFLPSVGPVTSAKLGFDARTTGLIAVERQTVLEITLAYLAAQRDRERVAVADAAMRDDSLLIEASESLVIAKMATRRDVLSAQLRLADDRAARVVADRDHVLSLDRLKQAMGLPIEWTITLAPEPLVDTVLTLDEEALVAEVMSTHPRLASAESEVERSELDWKLARNNRLPQVDFVGSYTYQNDTNPDFINDLESTGWLAGVQVSLPLVDRARGAVADVARTTFDQDRDRLALLRLQVQRSVRDAVRTMDGIAEELAAIRRTIELADEKVQYASAMFNLGRASNFDLTDAREDLVQGRTDFVSKLADYHAQIAVLESLTGRPLAP